VQAFKSLSADSLEFRDAITSTTKSITATFSRFRLWAEMLRGVVGDAVGVPSLEENRISLNQGVRR
jgi:hypothetical protein